jgi:hypothetical protein
MSPFPLEAKAWAQSQFGACKLGDRRRTRRAAFMAQRIAENPSAGFPRIFQNWSDLKAAYHLFDTEEVTFTALGEPHWKQTRACPPGRYLVINDTTEVDFGADREISGLAPTGNGTGRGFLLHSGLLVVADREELQGLVGQVIRYRQPAPKKENASQRHARDRESEIWGQLIDLAGPPPQGAQWIYTLDRGADNFEVFCHLIEQGDDWVVRVAQRQRTVLVPPGRSLPLQQYLEELPVSGSYPLHLRAREHQPARTATIEVRFGPLHMPAPRHQSPYVKLHHPQPIAMGVVWAHEVNAPAGVEPLDWALYASLAVATFEDACQAIGYYENRWLIEEWHKALKTGCREEKRQLKTARRLEAMTAMLSVVAVRLVQLKTVARTDPTRPADQVVPIPWIRMLQRVRKTRSPTPMTTGEFYRELAKLGGFLGRKGDGEPGWMTIWRGWEQLHLMLRGAELASPCDATEPFDSG